jgi:sensor histidine kinase YesM
VVIGALTFMNLKKITYYTCVVPIVLSCSMLAMAISGFPLPFRDYSPGNLLICFLFAGFTASVWAGTAGMLTLIYKNRKWYHQSYLQIFLTLFAGNMVLSLLHTGLLFFIIRKMSAGIGLTQTSFGPVFLVLALVSLLSTILKFLKQELEFNSVKIEELNIAKIQAEMEALKNQVDPHFIFNSLNALSYLIEQDPKSAILYNENLGKVYQYILNNKNHDLVKLTQEVEFINNYFFLMKIRFATAVDIRIHFQQMNVRNYLIPPISLQVLVENAIKHNNFNIESPLCIDISANTSFVTVKNEIHVKEFDYSSPGTGLMNLNNRYQLITNKSIIIEKAAGEFSVKLPLISS